MEPVFYNDDECREILQYLQRLTQEAEALPDPDARELVFEILQYFDLLHRESLSRMIRLLDKHPGIKKDMENDFAIRTLLGLYELADNSPAVDTSRAVGFVSADEVRVLTPVRRVAWMEAGQMEDFQDRPLQTRQLDGVNVLICKVDEQLFAVKNACVDTALPLDAGGYLEDHYLVCPWHGCRYDLITGELLDKPGVHLETFPIKMEANGIFQVEVSKNN